MLKFLALALTLTLALSGCDSSHDQEHVAALQAFEQGALLIDVRSEDEWNEGHIDGAIRIVHTDIVKGIQSMNVATDTEIILYCRSGNRAGIAQAALEKAGFTNIVNAGGYKALARAQHALKQGECSNC